MSGKGTKGFFKAGIDAVKSGFNTYAPGAVDSVVGGAVKASNGFHNNVIANAGTGAAGTVISEAMKRNNRVRKVAAGTLKAGSDDYEEAMKHMRKSYAEKKGMKVKDVDDAKVIASYQTKTAQKKMEKEMSGLRSSLKEGDGFSMAQSAIQRGGLSRGEVYGGMAKDYFVGGSAGRNAARIGTAVGAYTGVNLMGRAITGGNAYQNNSGRRDIAGIPFI